MDIETKVLKEQPEVILISDRESSPEKKQNPKTKKKECVKRKVQIDPLQSERLIVTQKVKTQKIRCIINLSVCEQDKNSEKARNETKCKYKNKQVKPKKTPKTKHKHKKDVEPKNSNLCINRVAPSCKRNNCQLSHARRIEKLKSSKVPNSSKTEHVKKSNQKKECSKPNSKDFYLKISPSRILLSPISSSDFDIKSGVSYENVSSDSLETDEELDTLIKRTKDREKKFWKKQDYDASYKNLTQECIKISSDDDKTPFKRSASLHSLHSTSTVVLEPHSLYSPTPYTQAEVQLSPISLESIEHLPTEPSIFNDFCEIKSLKFSPINISKQYLRENNDDLVYPIEKKMFIESKSHDTAAVAAINEPYIVSNFYQDYTIKYLENNIKFERDSPKNTYLHRNVSSYTAGTEGTHLNVNSTINRFKIEQISSDYLNNNENFPSVYGKLKSSKNNNM